MAAAHAIVKLDPASQDYVVLEYSHLHAAFLPVRSFFFKKNADDLAARIRAYPCPNCR